MPHSLRGQLAGLIEQGIRGFLVQKQAHRRRSGFGIAHGPQAEIGQFVGGVPPVLVQAAHIQVGIAVIAAENIGHLGGLEPHVGGHPDIQLLNELHGLLRGQNPLLNILLIIRIHILVKASPGDGRPRPLHEKEKAHRPRRFAGVMEGGGGPPGHPLHHGGHVLQLLLPHRVLLFPSPPGTGCGQPLSPVPDGLQHLQDSSVKDPLVNGFRIIGVQHLQQPLGLFIVLDKAMLDHIGPGRDEMGPVGAEVVGHIGNPSKLSPVPLPLTHIVAPLDRHGLILPIGEQFLLQLPIVLVGDVKGVIGPLPQVGQVLRQPVGVELNGEIGPPNLLGGPAHQLFVVIDVVAEGPVDLRRGLVPAHETGHALSLLVNFRVGPGPGDIHIGPVGMEHAVECLNSFGAAHLGNGARPQLIAQGGAGGGVGMDCHNTSPYP